MGVSEPRPLVYVMVILCLTTLTAESFGIGPTRNNNMELFLNKLNNELRQYRHFGAELAWNMSINMTQDILDKNEEFTIERNIWTNEWCTKLMEVYHYGTQINTFSVPWTIDQLRQLYLICRGPRFTSYQLSNILAILSTMQKMYNTEICFDNSCMRMEPDLNRIMESTRDEKELQTVWTKWHETIGTKVKPIYINLVQLLNKGARQAGHSDMGECWREETEINDLKLVANKLYADVKYLYQLLHTFVRYKLENFYRMDFKGGPIPAHLLGNMYAQNWESLIDIVWDEGGAEEVKNPLVKYFLPKNATVIDMVKSAEDFFVSMGLPNLPAKFWENSYFEDQKPVDGKKTNARNCHGSAANMFGMNGGDFRMMMCAEMKDEDLVTFQHEIGHIVYFMAYEKLPTLFQDGANSAFHESVGDSVTYDLKPRTLKGKIDMKSLLKSGLAKLPQVGYGLLMDRWRWDVFETENAPEYWNKNWWQLNNHILGVTKPDGYDIGKDTLLDAAGKFHIIDNIPYIRYFLASFLQIQFYESMCKAAGWTNIHACQIRGSKQAGNILWKMMSQGTSKHWSLILEEMTGTQEIKSDAFLKYYRPLKVWLEEKIRNHNLTIGW